VAHTTQRVIDAFLPRQQPRPETRWRLRFLVGSTLVGLAVATCTLLSQFLVGFGTNTFIIGAFAISLVGLLAAIRAGVSFTVASTAALALVSAFLVGVALVTKETQWEQLQWLVLLPLIALFLNEPRRTVTRPRHIGFLAVATVVAILLGVLIVVFHRLGWTLGEIETLNQDAQDVTGLIDFALFVMSVTGLLRIHRLALSRAEEEVALLRSMLSVCAWCGRLKDADEGWVSIERYMTKHTTTLLSHGICPTCEARLQAEVAT